MLPLPTRGRAATCCVPALPGAQPCSCNPIPEPGLTTNLCDHVAEGRINDSQRPDREAQVQRQAVAAGGLGSHSSQFAPGFKCS